MAQRRRSFKTVLNETVRGSKRSPASRKQGRYQVQTFNSDFQPGIDPTKLNQMADQLEVEEYGRKSVTQRVGDRS